MVNSKGKEFLIRIYLVEYAKKIWINSNWTMLILRPDLGIQRLLCIATLGLSQSSPSSLCSRSGCATRLYTIAISHMRITTWLDSPCFYFLAGLCLKYFSISTFIRQERILLHNSLLILSSMHSFQQNLFMLST